MGETILVVQDVKVIREDGPTVHILRLVASGSGFAPGAVITVDGQSAGTLISGTATQLVVENDTATFHLPLRDIGVSNPDGTAALSLKIEIDNGSDHGSGLPSHPTPVAHPTPTADMGMAMAAAAGDRRLQAYNRFCDSINYRVLWPSFDSQAVSSRISSSGATTPALAVSPCDEFENDMDARQYL